MSETTFVRGMGALPPRANSITKNALCISNIVTAFGRDVQGMPVPAIGTKVTDPQAFLDLVMRKIESHDVSKDREPGQHFIIAPELRPTLVGGVGKRTLDPSDYVLRPYRGKVRAFLKRERAEELTNQSFIAVIVYTREAYLNDPDVQKDEVECNRIKSVEEWTHVLIAIIAGSNYMSPDTAIHNIAGGNNEWNKMTLDEIRTKAKWVEEIDNELCVVAD